jgi:hypothetical protein
MKPQSIFVASLFGILLAKSQVGLFMGVIQ